MPYKSNDDLPDIIRWVLPDGAQSIWRGAFNGSADSDGEDAAGKIAWAAVKNKYKKDEDGNWCLKVEDADDPSQFHFVDASVLDGTPRRTGDGYLVADARVARAGIQVYAGRELGRPDLSRVSVYRPPEEVFDSRALRSMAHRPLTLKHPPEMVDKGNWKKYAVGQTGGEIVRDGDAVRVPMVVMDHDAISAVQGGVRELSMGYTADIVWQKGTTDAGESYDAIQKDIRANHLAIVPVARGGSNLRIGDGHRRQNHDKGARTMKVLQIDNAPIEFADEISAAHVQNHIHKLHGLAQDLQGKLSQANESSEEAREKMERGLTDAAAKVADLQKQLDAKNGECVGLHQQVKDAQAKFAPEALDEMVKVRADVIDRAATIVDQSYDFAGKSIEDIRRSAVAKKLGDGSAKAMNDAAVEGAFTALTANHTPRTGTTILRDALSIHRPHSVSLQDMRTTALAERDKQLTESWRPPQRTN